MLNVCLFRTETTTDADKISENKVSKIVNKLLGKFHLNFLLSQI